MFSITEKVSALIYNPLRGKLLYRPFPGTIPCFISWLSDYCGHIQPEKLLPRDTRFSDKQYPGAGITPGKSFES